MTISPISYFPFDQPHCGKVIPPKVDADTDLHAHIYGLSSFIFDVLINTSKLYCLIGVPLTPAVSKVTGCDEAKSGFNFLQCFQ